MRIESGPATTDRNWHLVRAILFLAFAGYFVYDGAVGWPARNRQEATARLSAPQPFNGQLKWDDLGETPTQPIYERLQKADPQRREEVHGALGKPALVREDDEYFASRYGYGRISYTRDRVSSIGNWIPWYKTREEVRQQFYWAILPALPGLYFLWRLYKAVTLRVVVDDEGMVYDNQRIAFDAMRSLRDYSPKGWIDLYYVENETEKKLRLDNQKVRLFDEIIDAICQAKGFRNEAKAYREEQQRRKAEEDRAAAAEDAPDEQKDAE